MWADDPKRQDSLLTERVAHVPDAHTAATLRKGRAVDDADINPGQRLHRYLVLDLLGRGGMAVVYKAFDPELDRNVAIKVMSPQPGTAGDTAARSRFTREAQAMARISHANVIEVYDVGTVDDHAFIAMKLVDGSNLSDWARERARPWREILAVYLDAGRGLAAAHRAGLVHRDFKPANVLVGKDDHVYVTDFGLARMVGETSDEPASPTQTPTSLLLSEITRTGTLAGTEGYIAPEIYGGSAPDARSDQFSFCVSLYKALFQQPPFDAADGIDARSSVGRFVAAPDPADSDVPSRVRNIVRRGLALRPEDRFASMDALLAALVHDPGVARRRGLAAGAAVVAVAAIAWLALRRDGGAAPDLCAGAAQNLIGVWDPSVKATGERAFAASNLPYADQAWRSTAAHVDRYASAWVSERAEACNATRVRGEQSDEVLSLRMLCLDRRLQELKALGAQFAHADAKTVEKSLQASSALVDLDVCANVASLKDVLRPPASPLTQQRIAAVDDQLAVVKSLHDSGKLPDTLPLAQAALTAADDIGYAPLQGEALLALGTAQADLGNGKDAEPVLYHALAAAERGHDDRTRAAAASQLFWVIGVLEDHFEAGRPWEDEAQAIIDRLGGDNTLTLRLLNFHAGWLYTSGGKTDELLAHQKRYVALREKLFGDDDLETVLAIGNLGVAYTATGDFDAALEQYRIAAARFQKLMGNRYVRYGLVENNMADVLAQQGHAAEALRLSRDALDVTLASRGPSHHDVISIETTVGISLVATGDIDGALAFFREYEPNWRKSLDADNPLLAEGLVDYGDALAAHHDTAAAIKLVEDVVAVHRAQPGLHHPILAMVLSHLAGYYLDAHRPADALAAAEEAVTLGTELRSDVPILERAKLTLARALRAADKDPDRARALASDALAFFKRAGMARAAEAEAFLAVATASAGANAGK